MSLMRVTAQRSIYRLIKKVSARYARPLLAASLALLIATANVAPAFAQNPLPKQDPTKQDPSQQQPPPPGTYGNIPPASQAVRKPRRATPLHLRRQSRSPWACQNTAMCTVRAHFQL